MLDLGTVQLPVEAVTETFAIIANRGGGKSSTARVLTEELHRSGQPVVVLDPKGDWHGIRTSVDGNHPGLPFAILGGDHGDLPLHPDAGAVVADALVQARASAVIDLSALSKTKARTFATAFAERLYRSNRDPLHLVVDEGDILIPQRAAADTMRLLGAMEDLAKRGRHRGIGMTVISQRPADVSKSVLDLMETLIVLRVTGPKTRKAIMDWVDDHTDDRDQMRELLASLKHLEVGKGWVWSPGWLGDLREVTIRPIHTLDTHVTPRPGVTTKTAASKATVDIEALGEQMARLADQAQQNDPSALRKRIQELEATATRHQPTQIEIQVQHVPTPVSDPATRGQLLQVKATLQQLITEIDEAVTRLDELPTTDQLATEAAAAPSLPAPAAKPMPDPHTPAATNDDNNSDLPKAQRRILEALATYGPRDANATAVLAGYSSTGGGYRNALSALRTAGYITGGRQDRLELTEAGRARLGAVSPLPRGDALREHWKRQKPLSAAHRAVLDVLAEAHPARLSVEEIAARTGYAATGGGYRNALSRLRGLDLITGRRDIAINPDLVD